ncbi:MAG: hypothetical protein BWK75_00330 [Candidatus Altiarchaeales archaeon A3]|nr:MAG: hypothetical protein BWK75_00330 [Candidatus Altiarchaeales archaeon A3]
MDLEGYCRRELKKGRSEEKILNEIASLILKIKFNDDGSKNNDAKLLTEAILEEVKKTNRKIDNKFLCDLLNFPKSNVSMGEIGVGSRGKGDFFVHEKICGIASNNISGKFTNVVVGAKEHDDAGIVNISENVGKNGNFVVVSVDGTHSRLSEYPFIAGFHVARASLRDIYVKGAKPVALLDDLHLADDGDVGRLFDFIAGISTVSELADVPLVAGSTLRIGGDMVIGERMVSCVGAVGIINAPNLIKARKNVQVGDKILMTGGAGGGTIATTAIYSGNFEVVLETMNITFIKACKILHEKNLLHKIDAMLDVTNGGIRGDAYEVLNLLNKEKDSEGTKITNIIEILKNDYAEFFYSSKEPFNVLISTLLSQRTKDAKTKHAGENLFKFISKPEDVLKCDLREIENAIKGVNFYKTKAKRIVEISKMLVEKYNSNVPDNENDLLKLSGVGRKTANCVLAFAFDMQAIPVDTHVHRISNRIGIIKTKSPAETEKKLQEILPQDYWKTINYIFVQHGQNICKPLKPNCEKCKIKEYCNYNSLNRANKNVSLKFYGPKIKNLINKKVYDMLKNLNIDELGVSLDSLMLFVPPENCGEIIKILRNEGIEIDEIGEVIESKTEGKILLIDENNNEKAIEPLFRESAYTKIKKIVGEQTPEKFEEMKKNVNNAYQDALKKKQKILKFIAPAGI